MYHCFLLLITQTLMYFMNDFYGSYQIYLKPLLHISWILCFVIYRESRWHLWFEWSPTRRDTSKIYLTIFQLHRDKELACPADGSQSPTSMLRTAVNWSATGELSHDSTTSSGLSPIQMPHNLDHYHNILHTRCGCLVPLAIDSITYHRFLVLLNWDRLGTTTSDAVSGKNYYRFNYFFYSLDNCELSDKKGSERATWEDPEQGRNRSWYAYLNSLFVKALGSATSDSSDRYQLVGCCWLSELTIVYFHIAILIDLQY